MPGPCRSTSVSSCGVKYPVCGPKTTTGWPLAECLASTSSALLSVEGCRDRSTEPTGVLTWPSSDCQRWYARVPGTGGAANGTGSALLAGAPVPGAVSLPTTGNATDGRRGDRAPGMYGNGIDAVLNASGSFFS